jgi:hypothetical protein
MFQSVRNQVSRFGSSTSIDTIHRSLPNFIKEALIQPRKKVRNPYSIGTSKQHVVRRRVDSDVHVMESEMGEIRRTLNVEQSSDANLDTTNSTENRRMI